MQPPHHSPNSQTGKSFFKRKKQPIPVDLKATDFPGNKGATAQAGSSTSCTAVNPAVWMVSELGQLQGYLPAVILL